MHCFVIENNCQCDGGCFSSKILQSLVRLREPDFCLKFPDEYVMKIYAFMIETLAKYVTCYLQTTQYALLLSF